VLGSSAKTYHAPESLAPTDVLFEIHAISINWRDVAILYAKFPVKSMERGIAAF
jgi:NADPH:quinone reductase-like Zn-dependent oxidoreductase